jgi:signal transduction histidine kinase
VDIVLRNPLGFRVSGSPGAGLGLVGLAERVGLAGGRLHTGPDDGGGFVVRASLPWPAGEGRTA